MTVRQRRWKDKAGKAHARWVIDVEWTHPDGRHERIREPAHLNTLRGAEAQERQVRAALLDGTRGAYAASPLFKDFVGPYLEACASENKPGTVTEKGSHIRTHLLPAFADWSLDDLDEQAVATFKAGLVKLGRAASTVNNILVTLHHLLDTAHAWKKRRAPAPAAKLVKVAKAAETKVEEWRPGLDPASLFFLSFTDAPRVVALAPAHWRDALLVALHTGLRIGELRALRWDCVDFVGRLRVDAQRGNIYRGVFGSPKGGRGRELPLSDTALLALKRLRLRSAGDFVFGGVGPPGESECRTGIDAVAAASGVAGLGWHTLRHTFASHLVMRGTLLAVVQSYLGHRDSKTTERYAHLSPTVHREAIRVLDVKG